MAASEDASEIRRELPIAMQVECAGCGKVIDEEASVLWQSTADGYDFCSSECRRKFEEQRDIASSTGEDA